MPGKQQRERELARRRYERRAQRIAIAKAKKRRRLQIIAVFMVMVSLLVLGGYGLSRWVWGNDDNDTLADTNPTPAVTQPPVGPTPLALADRPAALRHKPVVDIPDTPAPKKLESEDLVVGNGPVAAPGDQLVVNYVGKIYKTGKQFDASWDHGQPFPFTLGQGGVIPGWDQGVAGMKVGGRRMLIIPPALGYGATGGGADIPPNSTLVFVIDLLGLAPPQ